MSTVPIFDRALIRHRLNIMRDERTGQKVAAVKAPEAFEGFCIDP